MKVLIFLAVFFSAVVYGTEFVSQKNHDVASAIVMAKIQNANDVKIIGGGNCYGDCNYLVEFSADTKHCTAVVKVKDVHTGRPQIISPICE